MTVAARLHVIPAVGCDKALVLRRGPTDRVASLLWDRATGTLELGQWLAGRIYEHRTDLSPDGRHMICFAGNGVRWWTAISRAPWLTALSFVPRDGTNHGGGAFTRGGEVFFNGDDPPDPLPDGLKPASTSAFPHGTDGFHMGALYPAMMSLRGWSREAGQGYDTRLVKRLSPDLDLCLTFALSRPDRAIVSNRYSLRRRGEDRLLDQPDWEWAEPWGADLQFARNGALWACPLNPEGPGEARLLHDLGALRFEAREAPYAGVSA